MLPAVMLRRLIPCLALVGCNAPANDLNHAQLNSVIDEMRPTLQVCYQAALDRESYDGEVKMQATLRIAPGGEVSEVELGDGGLPGMRPCLEQAIMKWRFPAAGDETEASLPLIFHPEKP